MNIESVEIGWLITDKGEDDLRDHQRFFAELAAHIKDADEIGYELRATMNHNEGRQPDALSVETHPHNARCVFISHHTLEHGETDLMVPLLLQRLIEFELKRMVPEFAERYDMKWGIIETER